MATIYINVDDTLSLEDNPPKKEIIISIPKDKKRCWNEITMQW